MITKWRLSNFKSIREEKELELGPLTIFAGANSSGKSTFIQSILLVAQTLSHKVSSRSVVLNGALTSLGQFDDLRSYGSATEQISIKWTCVPKHDGPGSSMRRRAVSPRGGVYFGGRGIPLKTAECEISFDADPASAHRDLFQIQPRLFSSRLVCTFKGEDDLDQRSSMMI